MDEVKTPADQLAVGVFHRVDEFELVHRGEQIAHVGLETGGFFFSGRGSAHVLMIVQSN
ncbi:hypothetical protein D3C71_1917360 [compost metagenome]